MYDKWKWIVSLKICETFYCRLGDDGGNTCICCNKIHSSIQTLFFSFQSVLIFLILKGIIEESAIICTSFLSSMQLIWFKYLLVTNIFSHGLVTIHPRSQGT